MKEHGYPESKQMPKLLVNAHPKSQQLIPNNNGLNMNLTFVTHHKVFSTKNIFIIVHQIFSVRHKKALYSLSLPLN